MKRAIIGIEGPVLSDREIQMLEQFKPYGIILFKRNCATREQLIFLNKQIKSISNESKIFIDQEGGRVARLKKPELNEFPSAASFRDSSEVFYNYKRMGEYLYDLGIDANCAPVADLFYPFADNIIGDRSFGSSADEVIEFASAAAEGLMESGIIPIIKHIPGHGRALVDSHMELPVVTTDLAELEETDFRVFKELNHLPLAMTAHIIFTNLDPEFPVSISKKSINYIREKIGFKGGIMSDDIGMKALSGSVEELTNQVLNAGCDIVLHCSGIYEESFKVLNSIINSKRC